MIDPCLRCLLALHRWRGHRRSREHYDLPRRGEDLQPHAEQPPCLRGGAVVERGWWRQKWAASYFFFKHACMHANMQTRTACHACFLHARRWPRPPRFYPGAALGQDKNTHWLLHAECGCMVHELEKVVGGSLALMHMAQHSTESPMRTAHTHDACMQVDAAAQDGAWGGGVFDAGTGRCMGLLLQRSSTEAWAARYMPTARTHSSSSTLSSLRPSSHSAALEQQHLHHSRRHQQQHRQKQQEQHSMHSSGVSSPLGCACVLAEQAIGSSRGRGRGVAHAVPACVVAHFLQAAKRHGGGWLPPHPTPGFRWAQASHHLLIVLFETYMREFVSVQTA